MQKEKITTKIFWEKMGNFKTRRAFFEELEKNGLLGKRLRIHFVSRNYLTATEILDPHQTEFSENGLILRSLHNALGDELFFFYLDQYPDQRVTLSTKQLLNVKIFLSHADGCNYILLANKYHLTYNNVRQICSRVAKFFS